MKFQKSTPKIHTCSFFIFQKASHEIIYLQLKKCFLQELGIKYNLSIYVYFIILINVVCY